MSSKNKTQVIIAGKIYTLSGYESEEYLQKVAAYLNGKITEFRGMDGYHRLSQEMRSILMNLNIADDYFKVRKKIEELEEELSEKEKELYEFRHEMITTQVRLENAEKEKNALEEKNAQLQEELIRLRAQTDKNGREVKTGKAQRSCITGTLGIFTQINCKKIPGVHLFHTKVENNGRL